MAIPLHVVIAIAIPVAFFLLGFIVSCFEKRPVHIFESGEVTYPPPYLRAMAERAVVNGFSYCDGGFHTKYKEKYPAGLLVSGDRLTLAVIGDGTIIGLPSKSTILMSRFRDGSFLFTADQAGAAELDPLTRRQILMKADFDEMFQKHSLKLKQGFLVTAFPENPEWTSVHEIYRTRVDRIVKAGLARYVDPQRERYCYSLWGSFRATIVHGIGQVFRPSNLVRHYKKQPG